MPKPARTPPPTRSRRSARQHSRENPRRDLVALARACAIQPVYQSGLTGETHASDESLIRTLRAWGVDIDTPGDAARILPELIESRSRRRLDPVVIAWHRSAPACELRLPTTRAGDPRATGRAVVQVITEEGEQIQHAVKISDLTPRARRQADGSRAWTVRIPLTPAGVRLAPGYHRLALEHAGETFEALLVCAPKVSYQTPGRTLGIFAPTYALRSRTNLGVGNLTDLRRLGAWSAARGAPVLSTLPLLSCFMDDTPLFTASPYSPVSRLFFNEVFLDPGAAPEFAGSARAQRLLDNPSVKKHARALRGRTNLVDYRASYDILRPVLEALAGTFFDAGRERSREFLAFIAENPQARAYARFRAVCERRGEPFRDWPSRLKRGTVRESDHDPAAARTHLYCQYELRRQIGELSADLASRGGGLYLDLAVGASPDGYDTWANQDLFMPGSSVGSPPDPTYTAGQDWGFPPMHPERARDDGYTYYIDSLRAQMRIAGSLRLDHVMALHRLFVVPEGMNAADGVYVGYREDELFAILSLESHRNECRVFGENLGTVPREIEKAMTRHKVGKMWVGQFSITGKATKAINPIEPNCVASLNTHDLPPFATFLSGEDVGERVRLGVFAEELAPGERAWRKKARAPLAAFLHAKGYASAKRPRAPELARAFNAYIASSEGELALVNLEDLWGETRMQNVPGTSTEHPNWRHKLARTLDEIEQDTALREAVESLAQRREKPAKAVTKAKPAKTPKKKTKRKSRAKR